MSVRVRDPGDLRPLRRRADPEPGLSRSTGREVRDHGLPDRPPTPPTEAPREVTGVCPSDQAIRLILHNGRSLYSIGRGHGSSGFFWRFQKTSQPEFVPRPAPPPTPAHHTLLTLRGSFCCVHLIESYRGSRREKERKKKKKKKKKGVWGV